ncbi:uncharacterized protein [Primulina eburnea]|uniref:uncharacterized protein n=1 Tax=Primulina eburnea TaxID=1245227 RepID=UPI003C6CC187
MPPRRILRRNDEDRHEEEFPQPPPNQDASARALAGMGAPQMVEKQRREWTGEDKKKSNLDNVAKDIFYKTLNKNTFIKIKMCSTAKDIWEKLIQICEGNEQTKENKLCVAMQKFENLKMKARETLNEFDELFRSLVNELEALGK